MTKQTTIVVIGALEHAEQNQIDAKWLGKKLISQRKCQRAGGSKGSIFLKNRHFIIQKRFNKLIYGINAIIKCVT